MLDFDEEEFICVMTDNNRNGDNRKRPGCGWVVVLVAIILLVLL